MIRRTRSLESCVQELSPAGRLWLSAALFADPDLAPELDALTGNLAPARQLAFLTAFTALLPDASSPAAALFPALTEVLEGCSGRGPRDGLGDAG